MPLTRSRPPAAAAASPSSAPWRRGGTREAAEGDYSELLASSVFCLVLQGDGWTARFEDAVLHG